MQAGDLLVVNYVGETWDDGKVFDSSFDRGAPAAFQIGVGQVVKGWDAALVGQTVGSRVVMALPPELGYGTEGNADAGISGTDTLVFVVDIIATYPAGSASKYDSTAADPDLTGKPAVTGLPGAKPTVTVPAGATPPTEITSVVLSTGSGPRGDGRIRRRGAVRGRHLEQQQLRLNLVRGRPPRHDGRSGRVSVPVRQAGG